MSVKAALERAKLKQDRDLKEKELEVTKEGQKKSFLGNVIGSVSSLLPKGKYTLGNSPVWYKQYIKDVESVTNIPVWIKASKPNYSVSSGRVLLSSSIQLYDHSGQTLRGVGSNVLKVTPSAHSFHTGSTARVVVHRFMPHVGMNREFDITGDTGSNPVSQDYPINRATLMTITELGKINSRAIPNDPSIPGMYLLAGTEVYSFLAELKFIIDTARHYQDNDITIPRALIEGKGYDYNEVISNLPEYRKIYKIVREYALSSVPLPDDFTLLARRIWMNTVVIRDAQNTKNGIILFRQEAFGQIAEDGTAISFSSFNNVGDTTYVKRDHVSIEGYLNKCISNIATNEEFLTLISNMRAANVKFAPIPELEYEMQYEIMADDEVKLQLMNIVTFPSAYAITGNANSVKLSDWTINQTSSGYVTGPSSFKLSESEIGSDGNFITLSAAGQYIRAYTEARVLATYGNLFNSFVGWDSDKMLVATRLHPLFSGHAAFNGDTKIITYYLDIGSCGSELILQTDVAWMTYNNTMQEVLYWDRLHTVQFKVPTVSLSGTVYTVSGISNDFSIYSPQLQQILQIDGFYPVLLMSDANISGFKFDSSNGSVTTDAWMGTTILFEADDYITVSRVDLSRIHEVCVLSEYFIPAKNFGSFTRK